MPSGRTDYSIVIAVLGILLAIGIPSLTRGGLIVGTLCLVPAAAIAGWWVVVFRRAGR